MNYTCKSKQRLVDDLCFTCSGLHTECPYFVPEKKIDAINPNLTRSLERYLDILPRIFPDSYGDWIRNKNVRT